MSAETLKLSCSIGGEGLLSLLKNYCRNAGTKTSISVGVVGYPNVGKSSLINSLKRCKSVGVSSVPGNQSYPMYICILKNDGGWGTGMFP